MPSRSTDQHSEYLPAPGDLALPAPDGGRNVLVLIARLLARQTAYESLDPHEMDGRVAEPPAGDGQ